MSKQCVDCEHYNIEATKGGRGNCLCEATGKFKLAHQDAEKCSAFKENIARGSFTKDILIEESRKFELHKGLVDSGTTKYCSDGMHLNTSEKKGEGCYQCDKTGKKVFGNQKWCLDFESSARSSSEKIRIYDEGKEAQKKAENSSKGSSGIVAAIMVLLLIICKLFKLI